MKRRRKKESSKDISEDSIEKFLSRTEPSVVHCCVYVFFLRTKDDGRKKAKMKQAACIGSLPVVNASKYPPRIQPYGVVVDERKVQRR
jgi:hypothetical protein